MLQNGRVGVTGNIISLQSPELLYDIILLLYYMIKGIKSVAHQN